MLLTFGGHGYELRAGESVLEGLARHGVGLPSACRAGACHSCLLRAESGDPGEAGRGSLKPTLRASGYFLACLARPVTDVTVAPAAGDVITPAMLLRRQRPAPGVLAVWLRPPARGLPGGQHVTLSRGDGVIRPYSIANLPAEAARDGLEFHVRLYRDGAMSGWLAGAAPGATLGVGVPTGECFYLPGQPYRAAAAGRHGDRDRATGRDRTRRPYGRAQRARGRGPGRRRSGPPLPGRGFGAQSRCGMMAGHGSGGAPVSAPTARTSRRR